MAEISRSGYRPTLVVLTGVPGAGKTTLGTALGRALQAPFLSLDTIKEDIFATGAHAEDPYGLRLAAEAEMSHQLRVLGHTVVVDIWVAPNRDAARVTTMFRAQDREIVEVLCRVPADIAVDRYSRRQRSGPHRPADHPTLQRIRDAVERLQPMGTGRCVEVDTSRPVDAHSVLKKLWH